ncbi:Uncharacterised protein [Actinobacillus pleuropneumoniae]|nr:Uncharacterised protein [Actinobacillus pleuropneumoniae]
MLPPLSCQARGFHASANGHLALQRALGSALDDRSVGKGIRVGNAEFNNVGSRDFKLMDDIQRRLHIRIPDGQIRDQGGLVLLLQRRKGLIDSVHSVFPSRVSHDGLHVLVAAAG